MEKTVLFTASTFSHVNSFHLPYLEEFRHLGWKVRVACGGNVPQADTDYEIIPLPFEKSFFSAANFRAAAMLRELYRKEKIDLVCCHTSLAAFFTRLAAMGIKNRPEICNVVHGYLFDDDTPTVKKLILKTAEAVTAGVTDTLAAMNDYDYRYAQKHRLGRKVVFTPGVGVNFTKFDADRSEESVELRKSYGLSEDSVALIFAAEFSARKSQRVLIDAMKELPENVFLFLPGDGELLEENRSYALRCGLSGRVIFPGRVKDMPLWYAASDIAVSSSRSEGLPFNVMEAMYTALPVVASAVKGHTDLVNDGETGYLCSYGDAHEYAEKLSRLVSSEELRSEMGRAAAQAVKKYSLEEVLPQLMKIYIH